MNLRRHIKFGTKSRIIILTIIVLLLALWLLPIFPADKLYRLYLLRGGIEGHPEYCDHFFTPKTGIRLAITPYAFPQRNGGQEVDPNNWRNDPLAFDFMSFQVIVVPYVDYEITHDAGTTWAQFWRYDNQINEYPWCNALDSLDESNFWMWTRTSVAITHDAGASWIVGDSYKKWAKNQDVVIDHIKFDTPNNGQLVFVNQSKKPDPTLLTQDGGKTWHIDPEWMQ